MSDQPSTGDSHLRPRFLGVPPGVPHGWLTIDAKTYLDVSAMAPPRIIFDGREVLDTAWGTSTHPIEAGTHTVHCGRRMRHGLENSTVTIQVSPGQHVQLAYRGPISRGFDGVLGPPPQQPPGMKAVIFGAVFTVLFLLAVVATMVFTA